MKKAVLQYQQSSPSQGRPSTATPSNFARLPEKASNRWGKLGTVTCCSLPDSEHDNAFNALAYLKRTTRPTTEG